MANHASDNHRSLTQLSRRSFCSSLATAGAISFTSTLPSLWARAAFAQNRVANNSERTLVLIQLTGGNDGLNTVIPYADDAYHKARPSLAIGKDQVHRLDDHWGLHPELNGLHSLWEEGQLAIVQGVGYPQPDRSHFRSMDIWHSARPELEQARDGWLGRMLEQSATRNPGQPDGGFAIGMEQIPLALANSRVVVPVLQDLKQLHLNMSDLPESQRQELSRKLPFLNASNLSAPDPSDIDFLRRQYAETWRLSEKLAGRSQADSGQHHYPSSGLADQLKLVAQFLAAGSTARVFYLQLDGFDTHAQQAEGHAALMRELGDAVAAFWLDLKNKALRDRVCLATLSEFGRRVAENGSLGTDHGAASSLFVISSNVKPGLHGKPPSLTDLDDGDLKYSTDFRSVYTSCLQDWLGQEARDVLGSFPNVDLFKPPLS